MLTRACQAKQISYTIIRTDLGQHLPSQVNDLLAVIPLGGPMSLVTDLETNAWMKLELEFLKRCIDHSIPIFGVCLG